VKLLSYVALFGFLESLVIAIAAWRLGPREGFNRAVAAGGLLSAWSMGCLVFILAADPATALLFQRIDTVGVLGVNIPITAVFFVLAGQGRLHRNILVTLSAVGACVFGAGYLAGGSPWAEVVPGDWGNRVILKSTVWSQGADLFFIAIDLYALVCLVVTLFRSASERLKHMIRIILGAIVSMVPVYVVLGAVQTAYTTPSLTFIPGMILFAVLLYDAVLWKSFHAPSRELSEALPRAVPEPALLLDSGGRIAGANPAARELLGTTVPVGQFPETALGAKMAASLRISEHYDQFGDHVGAVALLGRDTELSVRERDVLALVVAGLSNAEIAGKLFISEGTVKAHVHRLLKKTGVRRRGDLIAGAGDQE
jgi:DNA-binding CsgD family transcriptional regulator